MCRAIATVGLNFGDEGKGTVVDFLARQYEADWIVRYGGPQALHNVVLPDGTHHCFSQFGSGTLAPKRPRTFLSEHMIVEPLGLRAESQHLREIGVSDPEKLLSINSRCLVVSPYHRIWNRLSAIETGHGSCGVGVGTAKEYQLAHGFDAIAIGDLRDSKVTADKLRLLQQRAMLRWPENVELQNENAECVADELRAALEGIEVVNDELPDFQAAIVEGSQGVLLDETFGFHPFTTWSDVTLLPAMRLLKNLPECQIATLGITRSFSTRHGPGPFPAERGGQVAGDRNGENLWQGKMRSGPLDLVLLKYAFEHAGGVDNMCVTWLDRPEYGYAACESYRYGFVPSQLASALPEIVDFECEDVFLSAIERSSSRIAMVSRGSTHVDKSFISGGLTWTRNEN